MAITFKSKVRKYNKRGICFVFLPKDQEDLNYGDNLKITIKDSEKDIQFHTCLRKTHRFGFYVPASVSKKYKLHNQEREFKIEKMEGFVTNVQNDGRVYLPQKLAENLNLNRNEIIKVKGTFAETAHCSFSQVKIRERNSKREFSIAFNQKFNKKEGHFKIESIVSRNKEKIPQVTKRIIKNFNYGILSKNQILVFHGNRMAITINSNFKLKEIALYLGCFFADGTKKGNSWGICASTHQQAQFYLQNHLSLIKEPQLSFELTYTNPNPENEERLKEKLQKIWKEKANVSFSQKKIWIYNTKTQNAQNRNKYGALSIREHRQLIVLYYNNLLSYLIEAIILNQDKELALEFLCGVLEGDGAPSAKGRGEVIITTNNKEAKVLKEIFKIAKLQHRGYQEKQNCCSFRIGSLELIKNMPLLKNKLFKYYPKRRKKLQERLANTGCARFLLHNTKTSNFTIGKIKEFGILDEEKNLTSYGEKVKQSLKEFVKVTVE